MKTSTEERIKTNLTRYDSKLFRGNPTARNYVEDVTSLAEELHEVSAREHALKKQRNIICFALDNVLFLLFCPVSALILLFKQQDKFFFQGLTEGEKTYTLPTGKEMFISGVLSGLFNLWLLGPQFGFTGKALVFMVSYSLASWFSSFYHFSKQLLNNKITG
jgi:hypothetical protein